MKYGLTPEELKFLDEKIIAPLKQKDARVFIFGSRAKGTEKKFSDIDLLYIPSRGTQIKPHFIYLLLEAAEHSSFPYKIDLVEDSELAESYRPSVEQEKIEL